MLWNSEFEAGCFGIRAYIIFRDQAAIECGSPRQGKIGDGPVGDGLLQVSTIGMACEERKCFSYIGSGWFH